jgi:Uncharacterised nucleotidyltransferase
VESVRDGWRNPGHPDGTGKKPYKDKSMISPLRRILVEAADLDLGGLREQALMEEVVRQEDLGRLTELAVQEGLACLLYKHLKRAGGSKILPTLFFQGLQGHYERTVAFNLGLIHGLKEVLSHLQRHGLEVVLLQGMALLQDVYQRDIGLRSMTDIDLWVRCDQYPGLVELLARLGFQRDQTYPNVFKRGIVTLDLHTHFLWADRIRARRHLLGVDQDAVYRETVAIDIEGEQALLLSPADQVFYLGLHAFKHNLGRLIWLVDLKLLLQRFDPPNWIGLADRARNLGLRRHLKCLFYLLHHLFQFDPPPEVRRFMVDGSIGLIEERLLRRRVAMNPLPAWAPPVLLLPEKGFAKRLSCLLEASLPREEVLRQIFVDYPGLKRWRLYWMRILQLLGKLRLASKDL